MKRAVLIIVAAAVIALVLGAAVFFTPGFLYPTLRYESRVAIDLPRQEVWDKFNDESGMKDWLKGLKSIELVEGKKGEPGSRYRLLIDGDGEEIELFEEMREIRPPGKYSFTLEAEPLVNEVEVIFSDAGGKTDMVQKEAVTGRNLFWRSLFYWLQSTFQRNAKDNLTSFKKYAEREKK